MLALLPLLTALPSPPSSPPLPPPPYSPGALLCPPVKDYVTNAPIDAILTASSCYDLSAVTSLNNMFRTAVIPTGTNVSISAPSATTAIEMFRDSSFLDGSITIEGSALTDLKLMFAGPNFNSEIFLDMSSVTNIDSMFYANDIFNRPVAHLNASSVKFARALFEGAFAERGDCPRCHDTDTER
eukprot:scaffold94247_cov36-Tisochrysis_lutea.AAC.1